MKKGTKINGNVKSLGLCGHTRIDDFIYAVKSDGKGLYCIVPHTKDKDGGIYLFDSEFEVKNLDNVHLEIFFKISSKWISLTNLV